MDQQSFLKAAAAAAAAAAATATGGSFILDEGSSHSSESTLDESELDSTENAAVEWGTSASEDVPGIRLSRPHVVWENLRVSRRISTASQLNRASAVRRTRTKSELVNVVLGSETNTSAATKQPILSEKPSPSRAAPLSSVQDTTLRQKAVVFFHNYWPEAVFVTILLGLTVLTWFGIKSVYRDPAILTGRFFAATVVVCFTVFLLPFVRVIQGLMYDKLASVASFFNPHLHKALGVLLIAAGSFHGILWNIATFRSCEGTWCLIEREGYDNPLVHAACIRTFCHDKDLPFDAYARGGLPSFANAFSSNLPLNLQKSQSAVRSFYYGYITLFLFLCIGVFTLPRIRRERFELFYYSHHIYIVAIPALFVHCWTVATPSFPILVMVIPCGIAAVFYACDKLVSIFFRRHTSANVDTIFYSDGRILELRFKPKPAWPLLSNPLLSAADPMLGEDSPSRCTFAPGAYIDINCPAVSKFQWHPFTISSAPDAGFVSVTMQVLRGGWTEQVANACKKLEGKSAGSGKLSIVNGTTQIEADESPLKDGQSPLSSRFGIQVPLHFNISGPFGAPSVAYQNYDCLVGIGGGIGFTPFMSILKDFLAEKRRGDTHSGVLALFYGVCRNLDDVAWWSSLSNEPDFSDYVSSASMAIGDNRTSSVVIGARDSRLIRPSNAGGRPTSLSRQGDRAVGPKTAMDLSKGLLGITLFCTGAKQEQISAAKAVAAPGISVRPGRPRFDNIFKNIGKKLITPSSIGVFVCGGDSLCNSVENAIDASAGGKHEFVFHKEIFG